MQRSRHHVVGAAIIAVMTIALLWAASRESEARPDEAEWITSGYRTYELITGLAPPSDWETGYFALGLDDWGNKNPPVGKLIIGLAVATFREPNERVRYVTTWPFDHAANLAAGNIPPFRLLTPARVVMALFGGACLALVYVCCVQVVRRRWLSLLAPVVLFGCFVFVDESTKVHTDIIQVTLLLAAIVAWNQFLVSARAWSFYIALIFAGLSCAVKFSSGPLVLAWFAYCCMRRDEPTKRIARGLAVLVVPFAVFTAVNPYLYPTPIHRTIQLVQSWSVSKRAQQELMTEEAVTSSSRRIALVASNGILAPRLASWSPGADRIASAAGMLAALCLLGAAGQRTHRRRDTSWRRLLWIAAVSVLAIGLLAVHDAKAALLPLLAVGGIIHLVSVARGRDPSGAPAVARLFLIVFGTFVAATALWLPFDWGRYYLPVLVLMPVVYVAGLAELHVLWSSGDRARNGE